MRSGQVISLVSGKGGVGKTNLAANLAVAAAGLDARVLLVDGDLGLSNVDVLLGLTPSRTSADLQSGRHDFEDVVLPGPHGVDLLPAASARMDLAAARPLELGWLLSPVRAATERYDLVLLDVGAGVGPLVVSLAAASDLALLVATPEPTSLADAYATAKVLHRSLPGLPVELIVNAARDELQAHRTHLQLERLSRRFLEAPLPLRGFLPRDERVEDAVARQAAVVSAYPTAPASKKLIEIARGLLRAAPGGRPRALRSGVPCRRMQT